MHRSFDDPEKATPTLTLDVDGYLAFSPNDPENPKTWSTRRRWLITGICMLLVINCSFASSAPTGALLGIVETFQVSLVAANLVTTLFLLGYCFGPLLWAPLSEYYGRRYLFYISFGGYFAFNFLCAYAPNFGSLLTGRFLTGTFASSAMSNAPAVCADLWNPLDRGKAMAMFVTLTFVGPVIGPITSGFIQMTVGWRWTFYELLILAAPTLLLLPLLPETYPPRRLAIKAQKLREEFPQLKDLKTPQEAQGLTLIKVWRRAFLQPWLILWDPISFMLAIYFAVVYTLLYMLFTIYPIVFQEMRGWNAGIGELPLLGLAIGAFLGGGVVFGMVHFAKKSGVEEMEWRPESRLPLAMIGAILLPLSIFWLSWTGAYTSVHWIVPTTAGVFVCVAIVFIFVSMITYLTDAYLTHAASAVAINTVIRSAAAAGGPLYTNQMFHTLTVGGAGSLLAGIACVLAPIPFVLNWKGAEIRRRSKWAPTKLDKPSVEKLEESQPQHM